MLEEFLNGLHREFEIITITYTWINLRTYLSFFLYDGHDEYS